MIHEQLNDFLALACEKDAVLQTLAGVKVREFSVKLKLLIQPRPQDEVDIIKILTNNYCAFRARTRKRPQISKYGNS